MNDKYSLLSVFSILIAVNFSLYSLCVVWWLYILINACVILFCILIVYVQRFLDSQNKRWIDAIYYFFSRREQNFKIIEKTAEFSIINENIASYREEITLVTKQEGSRQVFVGRYVWDQDESIQLTPCDVGDIVESEYDWKWTKVSMLRKTFLKKGDKWATGFELNNLKIFNLRKKMYLSNKVCDKVKILNLIIKLPKDGMKFQHKAKLVVEDFFGRTLNEKGEEIEFDVKHNCYKKTLKYPRKGRKYIIKVFSI